MTRHTPGPWAVGYGAAYLAAPGGGIDDESPRLLLADRSTPATTPTERDANIRRAVVCVNALDGVEDPAAALAEVRRALGGAVAVLAYAVVVLESADKRETARATTETARDLRRALSILGGAS